MSGTGSTKPLKTFAHAVKMRLKLKSSVAFHPRLLTQSSNLKPFNLDDKGTRRWAYGMSDFVVNGDNVRGHQGGSRADVPNALAERRHGDRSAKLNSASGQCGVERHRGLHHESKGHARQEDWRSVRKLTKFLTDHAKSP